MKVLSPAKINLMLRVLGLRKDGYHLLQTYFQLLDWGDPMEFLLIDQNTIRIDGEFNNLPHKENLIYKAAELLLPYKTAQNGISIKVNKRIPQGSGLGGGSSNAATTLRVLNSMWNCQLPQTELQNLALQLGADVPVFVLNQSAMAMGIGEQLTPYTIEKYYFVLIFPETGIATADVFDDKNLNRQQEAIPLKQINAPENWTNACLPVVLENFPEVRDIYNKALPFAPIYMSGTGSTLFACFKNKENAEEFMQQCPSHWNIQICQSKIN